MAILSHWKKLLSEFLGTFLLVFLCVAVTLPWDKDRDINTKISLTNGFTVASLITIFGHTSGCHINPAVTLSMLYFKHIERGLAVLYIIAQCFGGILGAAVLRLLTPLEAIGQFGVTQPGEGVPIRAAFGTEFVIAFVLLFVIFAVTDEGRQIEITGSVPLAVGLAVTICSLVGNRFSGACMNPARSLGPAVITGFWENHWIYWLAPITGGLTGASLYHYAFRVKELGMLQSGKTDNFNTFFSLLQNKQINTG